MHIFTQDLFGTCHSSDQADFRDDVIGQTVSPFSPTSDNHQATFAGLGQTPDIG